MKHIDRFRSEKWLQAPSKREETVRAATISALTMDGVDHAVVTASMVRLWVEAALGVELEGRLRKIVKRVCKDWVNQYQHEQENNPKYSVSGSNMKFHNVEVKEEPAGPSMKSRSYSDDDDVVDVTEEYRRVKEELNTAERINLCDDEDDDDVIADSCPKIASGEKPPHEDVVDQCSVAPEGSGSQDLPDEDKIDAIIEAPNP